MGEGTSSQGIDELDAILNESESASQHQRGTPFGSTMQSHYPSNDRTGVSMRDFTPEQQLMTSA